MTGDLAARQAALVAALVAGAPIPEGFDRRTVTVASRALLRKRAGVVAYHWPLLVAGLGDRWPGAFTDWAEGRRPGGGLRDGWDFARWLYAHGKLPRLATVELTAREAALRYDGHADPRPRRLPAIRRVGGTTVLTVAGRTYQLLPRRPLP